MPSEILRLTTEIVVSHSAATELTTEQLLNEIKDVYNFLSSLDGGKVLEEPVPEETKGPGGVKPSMPLKDIVKAKYVVCLECGKKLKTLKEKAHGLKPKEYWQSLTWTLRNILLSARIIQKLGARWQKREDLEKKAGEKKKRVLEIFF